MAWVGVGRVGGGGAAGRRPTTAGCKVAVADTTDSGGSALLAAAVGSVAAGVEAVGSVGVPAERVDLGCLFGLLPW